MIRQWEIICNFELEVLLSYSAKLNVYFDFRSLAVGSKFGYKIFSLNSVDNLEKIFENGMFAF